jgi:hypothetical protein
MKYLIIVIYLVPLCNVLPYVFLHIAYIIHLYHALMVQVISGRWCARVLPTSSLTCLRVLVPVVGLRPSDLMGPLLSLHHCHRCLCHP